MSVGFIYNNAFYLDAQPSGNYPIDHVSGYTLSELEAVLYDEQKSAVQWKNAIKNKYSHNPTEKYLDELWILN